MNEDSGTRKIRREDMRTPRTEEPDELTGEEINSLADLFNSAPLDDEEDTGSFQAVKGDDTGSFKPVDE
jgi:hypothetical protein